MQNMGEKMASQKETIFSHLTDGKQNCLLALTLFRLDCETSF